MLCIYVCMYGSANPVHVIHAKHVRTPLPKLLHARLYRGSMPVCAVTATGTDTSFWSTLRRLHRLTIHTCEKHCNSLVIARPPVGTLSGLRFFASACCRPQWKHVLLSPNIISAPVNAFCLYPLRFPFPWTVWELSSLAAWLLSKNVPYSGTHHSPAPSFCFNCGSNTVSFFLELCGSSHHWLHDFFPKTYHIVTPPFSSSLILL